MALDWVDPRWICRRSGEAMATAEGISRRLTRRLTEDLGATRRRRAQRRSRQHRRPEGDRPSTRSGSHDGRHPAQRRMQRQGLRRRRQGRTVRRHRLGDAGLARPAPHRRHRVRPHAARCTAASASSTTAPRRSTTRTTRFRSERPRTRTGEAAQSERRPRADGRHQRPDLLLAARRGVRSRIVPPSGCSPRSSRRWGWPPSSWCGG